jgi:hypothetical protein
LLTLGGVCVIVALVVREGRRKRSGAAGDD